METVILGGTGPRVTRLGLGGCPIGGHGWGKVDDRESIQALRRAAETGVNFFDTADIYGLGHSERIIARALSPHHRRLVIATKFGVRQESDGRIVKDISPTHLRQALENSLRRLRLDCIPLYYIHWPDARTPIEDAIEELERCRRAGKIGAIGVSNFSPKQLERACRVAPVVAAQIQYSLVDREIAERLLPISRGLHVPLITWGSLAQGLLTGKFNDRTHFDQNDRRSRYENFHGTTFQNNLRVVEGLKTLAKRLGTTPGQVAIRWLLDTPGVACVLFGAKTPRQVKENVAAATIQGLCEDDYLLLKSLTDGDNVKQHSTADQRQTTAA